MKDLKASDILIGSSDEVSLSKLWGLGIRDIEGYFSNGEFGFTVFKLTKVVFSDGSSVHFAGEHDIAFIYREDLDKHIGHNTIESLLSEIDPDLCEESEDEDE